MPKVDRVEDITPPKVDKVEDITPSNGLIRIRCKQRMGKTVVAISGTVIQFDEKGYAEVNKADYEHLHSVGGIEKA